MLKKYLGRIHLANSAGTTSLRRLCLAFIATGVMSLATVVCSQPAPPEATPFCTELAKIVGQIMPRIHYNSQPLNREFSEKLFNSYFERLDPDHLFFLAEDIEEFKKYQGELHKLINNGDISFVYKVYGRYLQRIEERVAFVKRTMEKPLDLRSDKKILVDRSEREWAENMAELNEIWRKQITNRLIIYKIMENEDAEADADNTGNQSSGTPQEHSPETPDDKNNQPETENDKSEEPLNSVLDDKTAEERVTAYYERLLSRQRDMDSLDVLEIFLNSLARLYDPHSVYMGPDREEDFEIDMSLSLEGIGAVLTTNEGYVEVVEIIPGGPAEQDNRLQAGDRIIAVSKDDEMVDVINMPLRRVVRMIRGKKGTTVHLRIIEAGRGVGTVPKQIKLVRDKIELKEQQAKSKLRQITLPSEKSFADKEIDRAAPVDNPDNEAKEPEKANILTITLPSFYLDLQARRKGDENYKRASLDIKNILNKSREEKQEIDGVILDLRYNSGGSLEEAVNVAGLFLGDAPVVQIKDAGGDVQVLRTESRKKYYDGPLIVMVNRFSASASEIVSAAIKDHGRGIVVGGGDTFGKGTVQHVYDIDRFFAYHPFFKNEAAGSLKFTIAKYYRVNGDSVQKKGVIPDIDLPSLTEHMDVGEDKLDGALEWSQIDPLITKNDVERQWHRYLKTLKEKSQKRVAENPEFTEINKLSQKYIEMQERKYRPLHIEKRLKLQAEEEEWFETIRRETSRRQYEVPLENDDPTPETKNTDPDKEDKKDPHLEETLRIFGDLLKLENLAQSR